MAKRRRRKRRIIPRGYIYIGVGIILLMVIVLGIYWAVKYSPTSEHMELSDYFSTSYENEAAVVFNNEYYKSGDDAGHPYAIYDDSNVYIELGFMKEHMDDGYVYDSSEITLRYATDAEVYTATVGAASYLIDKQSYDLGFNAVMVQDDSVYIAAEYAKLLTDFEYNYYSDPGRVFIQTAGYSTQVASATGKSQIRNLNGPKSPILEDVEKGEQIYVIRDTGKWSFVVSAKGVMGYMRNNKIDDTSDYTVEATLAERTYNHLSLGKTVSMGWHQVTAKAANADIANVLAEAGNINVISPTWFYLNNNKGGIENLASSDYVTYCHNNGIQVWGLVSNLEDTSIDTTTVLNSTSARDNLVNNLIAAAITYGLDGINIDIEQLQSAAADGYIQFIKELSIKCEKNDIILSVDNYVPDASNGIYNRKVQGNYADYVVIMGYDEHYATSAEAGSVASINWVEEGVSATLESVDASQVILGMPFYCRVWKEAEDGSLSSEIYGLSGIQSYLANNGIVPTWSDEYGQYYGEKISGNDTYKVWVEDENSLELKLKLIGQYNLAGAAYWKLGMGNTAAWNTIAKYM